MLPDWLPGAMDSSRWFFSLPLCVHMLQVNNIPSVNGGRRNVSKEAAAAHHLCFEKG